MKKRMRACISLLLALALVLPPALPAAAAGETFTEGNFTYTVDTNGQATVTGFANETATQAVVPDMLGGHSVTAIGDSAFFHCAALAEVTLPEGLTSIGNQAFDGCASLTSLRLPSTITDLGQMILKDTAVTHINIPAGLKSAGSSGPFSGSKISGVEFEAGMTAIPANLFYGAAHLERVEVPDTVTAIGSAAFFHCAALTEVTLPEGLTAIGNQAFDGCTALTQLQLPSTVTDLGQMILRDTAVTHINIPAGLKSAGGGGPFKGSKISGVEFEAGMTAIPNNLFREAACLERVRVPDTVTTIGSVAFFYCAALTEVTLPEGLTSIGNQAFDGCAALTSLRLPSTVTDLGQMILRDTAVTHINIPAGLKSAGGGGPFKGSKISDMEFEAGMTAIPDNLFREAAYLERVQVPDTVTTIGSVAFFYCAALTEVILPESVTELGSQAFDGCVQLKRVTIRGNVDRLESGVFRNCPALESVYFFGPAPTYVNSAAFSSSTPTLYYIDGQPGWTTPTWNGLNTQTFEKGILLSEPLYDDGTTFHHRVCDGETGEPIPGATVTADGVVLYTDAQGMVVLPADTRSLKIEAEGYETVEKSAPAQEQAQLFGDPFYNDPTFFIENFGPSSVMQRRKYDGCYHILSAEVNCLLSRKDVTKKVFYIDQGGLDMTFTLDLRARYDAAFNGTTGGNRPQVASFQLMQGDKAVGQPIPAANLGTALPQKFKFSDFQKNKPVMVQIRDANGKTIGNDYLKITVGQNIIPAPEGASFSLGNNGYGVTIPDDVPVFGGTQIDLDLPDFPLGMEQTGDGTLRFWLGSADLYQSADPKEKETTWTALKESIDAFRQEIKPTVDPANPTNGLETLKTTATNALNKLKQTMTDGKNNRPLKWSPDKPGFSLTLGGYAELTPKKTGGTGSATILLILSGDDLEFGTNVAVGVVPVVLEGAISYGATATGPVRIEWTKTTGIKVLPSLDLDLSAGVELSAGVGVKDLAKAGVYGQAVTNIVFHLDTELSNIAKWTIAGEFGLEAQLFIFSVNKALLSNTDDPYVILPRSKAQAAQADLLAADQIYDFLSDTDQYTPLSRDYMAHTSPWQGEPAASLFALAPGQEQLLMSSVYPDARPQVVSAGGSTVMVFLRDNAQRGDMDRTELVYSLYDSAAGTWSEAQPVTPDSALPDFYPTLYTDGADIYAAWVQAKASLADCAGVDDAAKLMEVKVARFDHASQEFGPAETVTDNDVYEGQLALAVEQGGVAVYWVENSENDLFGITGTNVIRRAVKSGDAWSVTTVADLGTKSVAMLKAGTLGEKSAVAWVEDRDRDLQTETDQYLGLWVDGSVAAMGDTAARNIYFNDSVAAAPALLWYDGADLKYITAPDAAVAVLLPEGVLAGAPEAVLASADGTKRAVLYARGGSGQAKSDLYAVLYDKNTDTWGETVALTNLDETSYFGQFSAAYVGQDLIAVFQKNWVDDPTAENMTALADLCWMRAKETAELELVSASCGDLSLLPGGQATLSVTVENKGTVPSLGTETLRLEGVTLDSQTDPNALTVPAIPSGGSATWDIPVLLPGALEGAQAEIYLDLSHQSVDLSLADLALATETYVMGKKNVVFVTVTNRGYTAAAGRVELTELENGTLCDSKTFNTLQPGQSVQMRFEADNDFLGDSDVLDVMLQVVTDAQQQASYNDGSMATLRRWSGPLAWDSLRASADGQLTGTLRNAALEPTAGRVVLAAYGAEDRLLDTKILEVALEPDAEQVVDWTVEGAAWFKAFYLGEGLAPILTAQRVDVPAN